MTEAAFEAEAETEVLARAEAETEVLAGAEPEPEAIAETAAPAEPEAQVPPPAAGETPEGMVSILHASFEDLCGLGMSVTQAKRVLAHRDEHGLASIDELDEIPGFPKDFLARLKRQLVP